MNTHEINGSNWKLRYYFIVAIPLAILTILVPLIILPTFNFIFHHLAAHRVLRDFMHWSWIITTFVLNLWLDISGFVSSETIAPSSPIIMFLVLIPLVGIGACSYITLFSMRLRHLCDSNSERRAYVRRVKWWILLFIFAIASFILRLFFYSFLELPAYLIYFFVTWYEYRRQKRMGGES